MKNIVNILKNKRFFLFAFVVLSVHLYFLTQIQFTAWPEMTFWPYLVLKGWLPYKDIAIVHTPLLIFSLSIFYKIFGIGVSQLKIFTWIWIIVTDGILFYVVKKLWDQKKAIISLGLYLILQIFFSGNGLWFDLALAPFFLCIFYFIQQKKYLLAGIFWIISFFIKQTALWLIVPIALQLLQPSKFSLKKAWPKIDYFILGLLGSLVVILSLMLLLKILPSFYYWAIQFGLLYLPHAEGQIQLPSLPQFIYYSLPFFLLFAYAVLYRKKSDLVLIFWTLFALLGILPRWELFHFQPALPFLAILITELLYFQTSGKKAIALIVVKTLTLVILVFIFSRSVSENWGRETRFGEKSVNDIAQKVQKVTTPGEKIFVLNYWDNLYALTGTIPAVDPWVPYLPWYLNYQDIQKNLVLKLKIAYPDIVVVGAYNNQGLGSYRIQAIDQFLKLFYTPAAYDQGIQIYEKNK